MSIASVVARGYIAGINFIPTRGYSAGAAAPTIIGGHFLPKGGKRRHTLSNVQVIYEKAKALPRKETKELRDAISEFVEPKIARQAILPDIIKVDYAALEANQLAYEKFLIALDNIQKNITLIEETQNEDEELFQLALICCKML